MVSPFFTPVFPMPLVITCRQCYVTSSLKIWTWGGGRSVITSGGKRKLAIEKYSHGPSLGLLNFHNYLLVVSKHLAPGKLEGEIINIIK